MVVSYKPRTQGKRNKKDEGKQVPQANPQKNMVTFISWTQSFISLLIPLEKVE